MRRTVILLLSLVFTCSAIVVAQEQGQYRSRILVDPLGDIGKGGEMSVQELEQQINSIGDPYARSSAGRHLARHYVQQQDYPRAIAWYREALAAEGLADIANREMLRELAQVYLLSENYPEAARALEQALQSDLLPEAGDFLLLAQAYFRQGDYVEVVASLDGIAAAGLTLDTQQTRQALALYYRVGAYQQSEELLQQLLKLQPNDPEHWHHLAAVYLKQNKRRAALDQLMLARSKGVPFDAQQITLLVDLQAVLGNPFGAAQLLEEAMAEQRLPADAVNHRKLFELYLQAREPENAAPALARAAALSGDTELYLYLAQLQMEQEQWRAMQQTLLTACADRLQDRYVSRANLLLGISQLKLDDELGARRSFINATLVGGANAEAAEWLSFMQAQATTEDEARRVVGPCYGSRGKRASLAELPAPSAPIASETAVVPDAETPAQAFDFKTVPARRFFYRELSESPDEILEQLQGISTRLGVSLVKAGGSIDGPVHLIRPGVDAPAQLALPVRGSPQARGRYKVRRTATFNCAYVVIEAGSGELQEAAQRLARALEQAGHELSEERRIVVLADRGDEGPALELQLGLR